MMQLHATQDRVELNRAHRPAPAQPEAVAPRQPVRVAQPNWAALGFGSAWEAEGRN